jgi:transmembrane sensor
MAHDTRSRLEGLISEQAAEWFVEFRTGDIDAQGRSEFDAWLRASPEHLRAYVEIAALWNESGSLEHGSAGIDDLVARARDEHNVLRWTPNAPADSSPPPRALPPSSETAARNRPWVKPLSLAAGLATVLFGGALLMWNEVYRSPEYSTEAGEQRSLTLSDGSSVELNSRSRLRVRFNRAERVVELIEGQALFHVAKNPSRPFIVHSAQTNVRAVGTSFDVYRKTAGTVVTVLEGRVAVSDNLPAKPGANAQVSSGSQARPGQVSSEAGQDVLLSAGEQLAITPRATARPTRANVAVAMAWTQRQLILDDAPLSQVAEEFNRYSARKLVAEDRGEPALRLSGVFRTDPEFLIRYLRERPDIVVTETSTEVRILRAPR